jgi:alkylation response protein AidB-like acyl-CoA dehydrogenase
VPIAISAEQRAVQASIRQWAAKAGALAAVRGLEPGQPAATAQPRESVTTQPWQRHWADLASLGVFSIALPEQVGGAGGSATDLAAALEQVTDALVPGPITPTLLAGLVLAPYTELPAVKGLLPALAAGAASVAVASALGTMTATPLGGGALRVHGRIGPVLGAGTTSHLLLAAATATGEAWFLLDADHPG